MTAFFEKMKRLMAAFGPLDPYDPQQGWCADQRGSPPQRDAAKAEGLSLLDKAWHNINAEGGYVAPGDLEGKAYCEAIEKALTIIESLGGMDPAERGRQ